MEVLPGVEIVQCVEGGSTDTGIYQVGTKEGFERLEISCLIKVENNLKEYCHWSQRKEDFQGEMGSIASNVTKRSNQKKNEKNTNIVVKRQETHQWDNRVRIPNAEAWRWKGRILCANSKHRNAYKELGSEQEKTDTARKLDLQRNSLMTGDIWACINGKGHLSRICWGTSQEVQCLTFHLPMLGVQVWFLVGELRSHGNCR